MPIKSVVTASSTHDLFSVVVTVLNVKEKITSLKPDMEEEQIV